MKVIWYNPQQEKYKLGLPSDLALDLASSDQYDGYSVLMQVEEKDSLLARQVLKQLNTLDENIAVATSGEWLDKS